MNSVPQVDCCWVYLGHPSRRQLTSQTVNVHSQTILLNQSCLVNTLWINDGDTRHDGFMICENDELCQFF